MVQAAKFCLVCKDRVAARGKPGLVCGGCQKSQHFECIKDLTEEAKDAYVSGKNNYLCSQCKSKHRASLSAVVTPQQPTNAGNSKKDKPVPVIDLDQSRVDKGDSEQVSTLLAVIKTLTSTVDTLNSQLASTQSQLAQALSEIERLKSNNIADKKRVVASEKTFTVNGVVAKEGEDLKQIVTDVIQHTDPDFVLEPTTVVERVKPKQPTAAPTILVKVKNDPSSANLKSFHKIKRRLVKGKDVGLDESDKIFVNESFPKATYDLYKKARSLINHGYKFVWVQEGRVLVRENEGGKVVRITSESQINSLSTSQQ